MMSIVVCKVRNQRCYKYQNAFLFSLNVAPFALSIAASVEGSKINRVMLICANHVQ